jgi:hypothetical protein
LHVAATQDAALATQVPCGFVPAGAAAHVPSEPGTLHCWQPPHWAAGFSQHTPSTQFPEAHSAQPDAAQSDGAHEAPSASCAVHVPLDAQK